MKKIVLALFAGLMLAGCSSAANNQTHYIREIEPVEFTVLQVSQNSKYMDAIPAGRYDFSMDNDTAGTNPARFSIYVSDTQYDEMNSELETDLVNSIGPGQDQEINLKDGNFVYIAATSNKTGVYEDNLSGKLEIESE